jgi:hypothetical protein
MLGNKTAQSSKIRKLPPAVGEDGNSMAATATSGLLKKPLFVIERRQNEELAGRVLMARTETLLCKRISYLAVVSQAIMSRG